MAEKMLKFISQEKAMPDKRQATDRVADLDEIYADFNLQEAEGQASRCSQCGVLFAR